MLALANGNRETMTISWAVLMYYFSYKAYKWDTRT